LGGGGILKVEEDLVRQNTPKMAIELITKNKTGPYKWAASGHCLSETSGGFTRGGVPGGGAGSTYKGKEARNSLGPPGKGDLHVVLGKGGGKS